MRRVFSQTSAPTAALLAALLLFAPLGRHGASAVVCFGWDGHVGAESAAEGGCADAEATPGAHCGACTDIPLPHGADADCPSFRTAPAPTAAAPAPLMAVLPPLDRPPTAGLEALGQAKAAARTAEAPPLLRRMVLRI